MLIKRRNFIQIGSLATGTLFVPQFLKAFEKPRMVPSGNKVAVVIQLSGGNVLRGRREGISWLSDPRSGGVGRFADALFDVDG